MQYQEMNGQELLSAYNVLTMKLGLPPRKSKFQTKSDGVERCTELAAKIQPEAPKKNGKFERAQGHWKITTLPTDNPHRQGTDAHAHFELMRGEPTRDEYLAKFDPKDQRKAMLWIGNELKANYIVWNKG